MEKWKQLIRKAKLEFTTRSRFNLSAWWQQLREAHKCGTQFLCCKSYGSVAEETQAAAEPAPAVSGIPVGVEEVPRESLAALLADSCPFLFQFLKLPWREGNSSLFLARLHHTALLPGLMLLQYPCQSNCSCSLVQAFLPSLLTFLFWSLYNSYVLDLNYPKSASAPQKYGASTA